MTHDLDRDWAAEAANVERYMARADLAGEAMEMRLNGATSAEAETQTRPALLPLMSAAIISVWASARRAENGS